MDNTILKVRNLKKYFKVDSKNTLKAVDNVSFDVYKNEILGVVGESGCGKTTLGRTILGLYKPTDGEIIFDGKDINKFNKKEMLDFKKRAQMIFQDPYASLNPRMTVKDIIAEGLEVQYPKMSNEEKEKKVSELLELVGLNSNYKSRYPHEFSGGQRQRIGIARTLAVNPEFIVCDEPISALDVSIQAQVINLFKDIQKKLGLTYVFIAHDLSMVRYISDRIVVMYLGKIVEIAESKELFNNPQHPYTDALLSAIPSIDIDNPMSDRRIKLDGEASNPINPKEKCRFVERCKHAKDICFCKEPDLVEISEGHFAACHNIK